MSVRLTTPVSRPEMLAPGMVAAVTELAGGGAAAGGYDVPDTGVGGRDTLERLAVEHVRTGTAGVSDGVGGPDEAGDGDSTTHILLRN
jgi:hypothetical protein